MLSVMLNDPNIENRRLALGTLNAAIHHKPDIVLPQLAALLPLVIKDSRIDKDLIREVQMGPFRHKVDDGLELRKVSIYFSRPDHIDTDSSLSERIRDLVLPHGERLPSDGPLRTF